jgi:hypothetical protein
MDPTTRFDFIAAQDLRESLDTDYSEMQRDFEAKAWKSANVIAGSIVEALLIDYLLNLPSADTAAILKLSLADAIKACLASGAITERNADLCSVIKSFRNLIHPGRMIRLQEPQPTRTSAQVAVSLVDLIVDDVAKARRASAGLTAEQIASKVARDSHTTSIVAHLLREVRPDQQVRLLTKVLPDAYRAVIEQQQHDFVDLEAKARLPALFRSAFLSGDDALRRRTMQEFVRILREEDGDWVANFGDAFVHGAYVEWVEDARRDMVCEHLIARASATKIHTTESLRLVEGIGPWLKDSMIAKWCAPYLRAVTDKRTSHWTQAKTQFVEDARKLTASASNVLDRRLIFFETIYKGKPEAVAFSELRQTIKAEEDDIPF